ncbi:MAG TPA: YozE family protein [Chitinophagaceae bacterium]|nr:YozE family protein [Chitinophagaceae bacterium]
MKKSFYDFIGLFQNDSYYSVIAELTEDDITFPMYAVKEEILKYMQVATRYARVQPQITELYKSYLRSINE